VTGAPRPSAPGSSRAQEPVAQLSGPGHRIMHPEAGKVDGVAMRLAH
jgi:hypothetical protein